MTRGEDPHARATPPRAISLNTPRLLIRTVRPHESHQYGTINNLQNDPRSWPDLLAEYSHHGAIQLFIIFRETVPAAAPSSVSEGSVVGFIQINAPYDGEGPGGTGISELSFKIHPQVCEKGYMKEALLELFKYIFHSMPGRWLYVETKADDTAVVQLMEGFGLLAEVGYARQGIESKRYVFGKYTSGFKF